jgi:hypothetical protein
MNIEKEEEIANNLGLTHGRISQIVDKFKSELSDTSPESLQLFNVWNFSDQEKLDESFC